MKASFTVLNMSCAACAVSVENTLKAQGGVTDAAVNYATSAATVEYENDVVQPEELRKAVQSIGYDLLIDADAYQTADKIQGDHLRQLRNKTTGAILLSIPVVIIGMFLPQLPYSEMIMWLLTTPVVLWFGRDFFIHAAKQARHRSVNMDTLVALSTGTAYAFSSFNTFFPQFWQSRGLTAHVYFEAAAVIIAFILLGKFLEEKAKGSTSSAIKNLMGLQPKTVTVVQEPGVQTEMPIEQVQIGHLVVVKPGEQIAVDGTVTEGTSYVNESMLTGESMPVLKVPNDSVFAGTVNQNGSFHFRAEKVGGKTILAQIIRIVQEAQGSKAPVQKLVDKIAGIFVPVVIVIALLAFAAWNTWGGDKAFTYSLLSMITVLVIACPCALGLATPTAIMVGIGKGAEQGILIKDADSLERAKKINAIVLDKTGTITVGRPRVTNVYWNSDDPVLKQILFAIESRSEHPLSDAITEHLQPQTPVVITQFESLTGKGVKATQDGEDYYIGTTNLLKEHGVPFDASNQHMADQWSTEAKTVVWFANERKVLAILAVSDQVKPTSVAAIKRLHDMGIDVHMLTGDNEATAKAVARQTGITSFRAEILPAQKANFVEALQAQGKVVAMVGDGINDSAALAKADVSIAMGKGSDIAMDVAKMTIMSSDLAKIPEAIKLSKATVATIRQNLFWAFIYNLIGIPIAAGILYPITGFLLNPMIAGAAMALSSVSVVGNSLRLKYKHN